jgi:hypothetical protein
MEGKDAKKRFLNLSHLSAQGLLRAAALKTR